MPKKGERATVCKRGHDLTQPGSRLKPSGRGGGLCRQCSADYWRERRGSAKTGPPSRYKGDETARREAVAQGLKRCPSCETPKPLIAYWNDRHTADGKGSYCIECASSAKRADYAERRVELLLRTQARKFGVTVEWLEETLLAQGGVCAICQRPCVSGRALAVDHNHQTGAIRGLLCANCNRALGLLQDSTSVVMSALLYLQKWNPDDPQSVC